MGNEPANRSRRDFIACGAAACAVASLASTANAVPARPTDVPALRNALENTGLLPPYLHTDNDTINKAFRIALGDLSTNILNYKTGLMEEEAPAIMAGLNYDRPWTRDTAINVWNFGGLIAPHAAKNTLLSVLERKDGKIVIGGQYWDAIIWATGAWNFYLQTGDMNMLAIAFEAAQNTLALREAQELDESSNLFRGPACYGDGVAAYPEYYAKGCGGSSGIYDWVHHHDSARGEGIPMKALSTNCLYYNAYKLLPLMAEALKRKAPGAAKKAEKLKEAILSNFYNKESGTLDYIADSPVNSDYQEALGISFAVMFGVADGELAKSIIANAQTTPQGIACVWPSYPRYTAMGGYGRHSGTVWPHAQGFWAQVCADAGETGKFGRELHALAKNAVRDSQFVEIYHPETGESYGGLQELGGPIGKWNATNRQTWSATAFLRMTIGSLIGLKLTGAGISFSPLLPDGVKNARLKINYRKMQLDITVRGKSGRPAVIKVNGKASDNFIPAGAVGTKKIEIE